MATRRLSIVAAAVLWLFVGLASRAQAQPAYHVLAHFSVSDAGGSFPYAGLVQASDGVFYGTTYGGGARGLGTIYRIDAGGTFTTLHSFAASEGAYPFGGMAIGSDGLIYGTTTAGGANNAGTIFKIDSAGTFTTLHEFTGDDGSLPYGSVILGSDGLIYGTTSQGGAGSSGTVFNIDGAGNFSLLHSFSGVDGGSPFGGLVQATDGRLYGTTNSGGSAGFGTIFRMAIGGPAVTLYSFTGGAIDGGSPFIGLMQATDGFLYGATSAGGANGHGAVFKIATGGTFTTLRSIGKDLFALSQMIEVSSGDFYAIAQDGELAPVGAIIRVGRNGSTDLVVAFPGAPGGAGPHGALVKGNDGNLYGTTVNGGGSDIGTIFQATTAGALTLLHTFVSANDGANPNVGLLQAGDGSLYGTTTDGGANAAGTIFNVATDGTLTTVASLTSATGTGPYARLVRGNDGALYGTASEGGSSGSGTIFRLAAGVVTSLHDFNDADGTYPAAPLVLGSDGKFYGTTAYGGAGSMGTVFAMDATGSLVTLHSFDWTDGANLYGTLVEAADGSFYGTTSSGGANGSGTIFRIDTSGVLTTIYEFEWADGAFPFGGLVIGGDGAFYGTTSSGGDTGAGTVFKIDVAGTLTQLHVFATTDGASPDASLVRAADGRFYGTTASGGDNGNGTIFRIDASGKFRTLHSFAWTDGASPSAELLQGSDGTFYGVASVGGPGGAGVVFSIAIANRAPTLENPGERASAEGDAVSLQLVASDADGDPLTFSATGLPVGVSVDPNTGLIAGALSYTSSGTYSVTVTVSDGEQSASQNFSWSVADVDRAPVLANPGDRSNAETETVSLQLVASDPDGDAVSFSAAGLPAPLAIDSASGLISGTLSFTSAGTYSVTVTATDGTLSTSRTFTWHVANTDRAPSLANPGPQSNLDAISYAASVLADAPGAYWRLGEASGSSLADSVGANPGLRVGGVSLGQPGALVEADTAIALNGSTGYVQVANPSGFPLAGDLSIELWVKLSSLASRQTLISKDSAREFELTVETSGHLNLYQGNGASGQNFLSSAGAVVSNVWQHIVVTRDTATKTIRFYVNGAAKGSAIYSVAPVAGTKAIDIGRSTAASRYTSGSIDEVALYPSALSAAQVAAHYAMRNADGNGTAISLPLVASDPDGDTLSFTVTGLPPSLSVNPATGLISGALSNPSAGSYSVTASVSDGHASASHLFTWTVKNPNRAPVLANPGAQSSLDRAAYGAGIRADLPVAYWRLGEASGTVLADSVGPNVACIAGVGTLGQIGPLADGNTALLLDGSSGFVQIANPVGLALDGDLTIEMWVKAPLATRQTLISRSAVNEFELTLETSGNLNFYQGNGTSMQNFLSSSAAVAPNTWQHIVVTRSTATKTIAFYVNGAAKGTAIYTVVPTASTKPINVGRSTAGSRYLNGAIDEVALYRSALSPAQVASHFTLRLATGANTPVALQLLASDPDGDTLTFSGSGLPPGLSLNTVTGVLSGTVTTASVGVFDVSVSVTDGHLTASQTFTWVVVSTNRAPIVTSPGPRVNTDNTSYAAGVMADSPGAYWRLGETSGASLADSAGGYSALVSGGVTLGQSGPIADGNGALLLNGATGYMQAANPAIALNGDLTIELWANVSLLSRQTLVSKDSTREFELTVETAGNLNLYQGDGTTGQHFLSSPGAVTPNTWQHIVVIRSAATNTIRFYVNCESKGSATYTVSPVAGTRPIDIGRSTAGLRYVNGLIDEVAIYPAALTAAQIGAHYALRTATGTGTPVSLKIIASDPDGDPIAFSATGLPPGLTIDAATGLIAGTLTSASVGDYSVTVSVTDGVAVTSVTFSWGVIGNP